LFSCECRRGGDACFSLADLSSFGYSWLKELQPFCAILDPATDTYASLRRNRFLFDVVIYTASRAQGGISPPSKELIAVAEQTREAARNLIFDIAPPVEVIQALLIMACYHE
jgi:hypothetical protein